MKKSTMQLWMRQFLWHCRIHNCMLIQIYSISVRLILEYMFEDRMPQLMLKKKYDVIAKGNLT